ncbi:hypothetical protein FJY90_00650 [Candidatus Gottesmanbacteria bacterium]|nr:hypothetical protein [Candidatus Gottesmanbacteria bacterium]
MGSERAGIAKKWFYIILGIACGLWFAANYHEGFSHFIDIDSTEKWAEKFLDFDNILEKIKPGDNLFSFIISLICVVIIGLIFAIVFAILFTIYILCFLGEKIYLVSFGVGYGLSNLLFFILIHKPIAGIIKLYASIRYGRKAERMIEENAEEVMEDENMRQKPTLPVEFIESDIERSIRNGKDRGTLGTVLAGLSERIKTDAEIKVFLKVIERNKLKAEALKTILDVLNTEEQIRNFNNQQTLQNLRYIAEKLTLENQIEDHYAEKRLKELEREAKMQQLELQMMITKQSLEDLKTPSREGSKPAWLKEAEELLEKFKWVEDQKTKMEKEYADKPEIMQRVIDDWDRLIAEAGLLLGGNKNEGRRQ